MIVNNHQNENEKTPLEKKPISNGGVIKAETIKEEKVVEGTGLEVMCLMCEKIFELGAQNDNCPHCGAALL